MSANPEVVFRSHRDAPKPGIGISSELEEALKSMAEFSRNPTPEYEVVINTDTYTLVKVLR